VAYIVKERLRPLPWHEFRQKTLSRAFVPLIFIDWMFDHLAYFLSRWAFLEVLEYVGNFSILVGVILYFAESNQRLLQKHYQAWQVINSAQGKTGNGGRIEALTDLYADHVPLVGVDVSNAYLQRIKLDGAELERADFSYADLRDSSLQNIQFQNANLHYTNFRNANLQNADFSGDLGATMTDADMTNANIQSANFTRANLNNADFTNTNLHNTIFTGADLSNATLNNTTDWQSIRDIKGANIHNITNAPDGFKQWALAHGAVDATSTTQP
jgi:uncharacterized protein YjbI with pentapeptide repeats